MALQASECSELLDHTRASCWIVAQRWPGKFTLTRWRHRQESYSTGSSLRGRLCRCFCDGASLARSMGRRSFCGRVAACPRGPREAALLGADLRDAAAVVSIR